MAELMGRGASIEETQIHGRVIQRNAAVVGADIRPGAIVGVERDANFRILRVVEIQLQVGKRSPPSRLCASQAAISTSAVLNVKRVARAGRSPGLGSMLRARSYAGFRQTTRRRARDSG